MGMSAFGVEDSRISKAGAHRAAGRSLKRWFKTKEEAQKVQNVQQAHVRQVLAQPQAQKFRDEQDAIWNQYGR